MKEKKAKPRLHVPDYCEVDTIKDNEGNPIWPAPISAIDKARAFIKDWYEFLPCTRFHCID
jgi:hypothetical protein